METAELAFIGNKPDIHCLFLAAPLPSLAVAGKEKIYSVAPDCAAPVLHSSIAVAFNIHDCAERIERRISGDSAIFGFCAAGSLPDALGLPLVRATGINRLQQPVAFPAAARAAAAVPCNQHFLRHRLHARWRPHACTSADSCSRQENQE